MCDGDEMINHIIRKCSQLAQKATRPDKSTQYWRD